MPATCERPATGIAEALSADTSRSFRFGIRVASPMTRFSLIRPIDQPLGRHRLLDGLKTALQDRRFTDFRLIVAYARSGPLYRLQGLLEEWRHEKKTSAAILGIDQQGTSKDALELALFLFDRVYVTREPGITFHPKMYLFTGERHAQTFIGSNNLTVGGTEKNFEAAAHLIFDLPKDADELKSLESSWFDLLPASCPATIRLDQAGLKRLVDDNVVVEERAMRAGAGDGDSAGVGPGRHSRLAVKPESPLPPKVLIRTRRARAKRSATVQSVPVRGHAIQIKPHHNGEIFLSITAVLQNPDFFGWPFTGRTVPKKEGNPSYPQREPDPVVNVRVFGARPDPVMTLSDYPLNTVYYERNREVRITASPLVEVVPEYSIMIMEPSSVSEISYEITIYTPDSPHYARWEEVCNQRMPSGGKRPRRYGWF